MTLAPRDRPSGRAPQALAIYLRDHEAASRAGADLFARMSRSQSARSWGPTLAGVAEDVAQDVATLRGLLRATGVRPAVLTGLALRAGERVGRLKPNGHLVTRAPLSDLVEVEAGLDAVGAKAAGWRALRAVRDVDLPVDLDELVARADDQAERLRAVHLVVAAAVL